jgi:hypothetical protein
LQPAHYPLENLIQRDPFDGAPRPVVTSSVPIGKDVLDLALLDDEDAREGTPAPAALLVKATIVGSSPVAYVADGPTMHVVTTGDYLAGRRVSEIDATGILLDDGTRLELSGSYAAPTGRQVKPLKRGLREQPSSATPIVVPSASVSTFLQTAPTPGPLPTIKRGAFPVGAAPTSDASAPTAFPYPYPYSPK